MCRMHEISLGRREADELFGGEDEGDRSLSPERGRGSLRSHRAGGLESGFSSVTLGS